MKRIGITQRVEVYAEFAERRDCLDQRWMRLIEQLGWCAVPLPNSLHNPVDWLQAMHLDGFVLTGGNDVGGQPGAEGTSPERDRTERQLLDFALARRLPVFGVCRGLQMLNVYLGGSLYGTHGHIACRHEVEPRPDAARFSVFREVNSFHRLAISAEGLAEGFDPAVHAPDGSVEAASHRSLPWCGVMWHPEREEPWVDADLALIRQCLEGGE